MYGIVLTLKKSVRCIILYLLVMTCFSSLILPSFAQSAENHELQGVTYFVHSSEFYQSVPFTVLFNITNIGSTVFDGTATLEVRFGDNGERSFTPKTFQISNLAIGGVYSNSNTYSTDDHSGRYWVTITIEPAEYSNIDLYVGQTLKEQGYRVKLEDSIYVLDQETYLHQIDTRNQQIIMIATVMGVVIALFGTIKMRRRRRR